MRNAAAVLYVPLPLPPVPIAAIVPSPQPGDASPS